jgi:4-amino-4-deoxy-L-arabinose transferase-like glycosyltransferase
VSRARLRAWIVTPAAGALFISLLFIAISLWWVLTDVRDVNSDNGRHLLITHGWAALVGRGDILAGFREFSGYPPGVHLLGAAVENVFGFKASTLVFAQNVVFVPLLALGCYGTAKLAFGATAGLLAVLFAFAAPMVMSMFHVFMLDAPEAAMVALTVWLLLASQRFERTEIAALAGLAGGLGMYTKATFPLFVAGLVVVLLARGGWRHPKGLLAFLVVGAALAAPWYAWHLDALRATTTGLVGAGRGGEAAPPLWYGNVRFPDRDELRNLTWYPWSLMNHTLYLPLTLFFVTGVGWALWRLRDAAARASLLPELLVGGAVGYVGVSMLILKDPRYSLPCLVYIAVLGAAWITALPRRPGLVAAALLAAVFAFNTVTHNLGVGGAQTITTSKAIPDNPIGEYTATVFRDTGYFEGPPVRTHAPFVDLLNRLHDERGARGVVPDQFSFSSRPFTPLGTTILALGSKLELRGFRPEFLTRPTDVWIIRQQIRRSRYAPCVVTPGGDGTGLYAYVGTIPADAGKVKPDCP